MTCILITGHALGDRFDNEAGKERATVVLVVGGQNKSLSKSGVVRWRGTERSSKFANSPVPSGVPYTSDLKSWSGCLTP